MFNRPASEILRAEPKSSSERAMSSVYQVAPAKRTCQTSATTELGNKISGLELPPNRRHFLVLAAGFHGKRRMTVK
jgi:hypothetical protein